MGLKPSFFDWNCIQYMITNSPTWPCRLQARNLLSLSAPTIELIARRHSLSPLPTSKHQSLDNKPVKNQNDINDATMSLTNPTYHHHLFTNSPSRITLLFTTTTTTTTTKTLNFSRHVTSPLHSLNFHFKPHTHKTSFNFILKSYQSDQTIQTQPPNPFYLDQFLSIAELLCFISSSIIITTYALNCSISKRGLLDVIVTNTGFAWGVVVMVTGALIGAWIRRRQWWRICSQAGEEGSRGIVNLVGRIEKLEEDLRSSATIIRVLSRQLEKLGIRFRVTRKALKEPIAETAALAQKNSEATRALAVQEDILEKELREIQKVLLAMQEQQQKQLELILAIGKSGKLWDNRREPSQERELIKTRDLNNGVKKLEVNETEASSASKGSDNDRP